MWWRLTEIRALRSMHLRSKKLRCKCSLEFFYTEYTEYLCDYMQPTCKPTNQPTFYLWHPMPPHRFLRARKAEYWGRELSDENVLQMVMCPTTCRQKHSSTTTSVSYIVLADANKVEDHTFHGQLRFTGDGNLWQDQSVDTLFIKNYQLFKNSLRVMTYEGAAGT